MRDLRGKPVIVTFLYTTCEDTCPAQAQTIRGALDELGEDVPALAIAVDPPRDTEAERARLPRRAARARAGSTSCSARASELQPLWSGFYIRPQSVTQEHQARFTLVDKRGFQRVGLPRLRGHAGAARPRPARCSRRESASPTSRVGFSRR